MNQALRRIAFFTGVGLLLVSMYWSQDGWNFDMAGDSGYQTLALTIGWGLAIAVTVVEFVFSSNYVELNPSLVLFGLLAYAYSIYTNYQGILHFQGTSQNHVAAGILGLVIDGIPEPLIAWGLYESRRGDFIGNLIKAVISAPSKVQEQNKSQGQSKPAQQYNYHTVGSNHGKGSQRRNELENVFREVPKGERESKPSRHNLFGE